MSKVKVFELRVDYRTLNETRWTGGRGINGRHLYNDEGGVPFARWTFKPMETQDFLRVASMLAMLAMWTVVMVVVGIMKDHLYNAHDERRVEWIHGLRESDYL